MSTTTTGGRKASQMQGRVWTIEAVRELGVTTDVETAAAILGIGRTTAYALARNNQFPVRLLRVGRRYLVPVQAILNLLAME
ncbi:helix-turn-helix domain-containing protein [Micromonospora aurantiaca]|uniref:helix-turn-helix domain-containing protein n=1 Tax=Micromonospora TaxID=1873 RepID=UPI00165727BC|nr:MULTISPECIES: helix-turn-helix domain-containing protein [Micromonospora]MBC9005735.1 helix-turn-helix domain-containing protein [Micromonospora aurantiaca]MCZ7474637.1 helix-turn-helix domain-containing protein [Micromonospora sp. WMMC273]